MSKELIYTPKGISNYTWLSRPDTKFNPDGVYTVTLMFEKTAPGVKELCKKLNDAYKQAQKPKKKGGNKPYKENEDGLIEIKLSQKAVIHTKTGEAINKTVATLDSKLKPVKADIGNGSELRAAFNIRPYDYNGCGISLDLVAVQIINLVEYKGQSNFDFDEEDGFVGESAAVQYENQLNEENWDEAEDDSGTEDDEDEPF